MLFSSSDSKIPFNLTLWQPLNYKVVFSLQTQ